MLMPVKLAHLEESLMENKKIAGLIGAMATLGAFNPAAATPVTGPAPTDILRANSFSDLLEPIPNAVALLQAVDENAPAVSRDENVQLAQYHHDHHHSQYRRYAPRVVVVPRYRRHHHHHHHHHSFYRRDY
jgi:hypothetical protein